MSHIYYLSGILIILCHEKKWINLAVLPNISFLQESSRGGGKSYIFDLN